MIDQALLVNGLWYNDVNNPLYMDGKLVSYMKIYTLGGTKRVMELSTYPRAFWRDILYYTEEVPFIVTEDDLSDVYTVERAQSLGWQIRPEIPDGTRVFVTRNYEVWMLGETAYHRIGDPIPDTTPMWVESETLSTPSNLDSKKDVFPAVYDALKGELATINLTEAQYREAGSTTWTSVPAAVLNTLEAQLTRENQNFAVNKLARGKDRMIAQIAYDRSIRTR